MKKKITEKMSIAEIIESKPEAAEIMMKGGLHCIGCHMASWESFEAGAKAHGLDSKKIKKMVSEINKK